MSNEIIENVNSSITNIDFEAGKVLDKVFTSTESQLTELEAQWFLPDATTMAGYDQCKESARHLQVLRMAVEDRRKVLKRPLLDAGKIIQGEAVKIMDRLQVMETPLRDAYRKVDEERAALEAEKERQLAARLSVFTTAVNDSENASYDSILATILMIEGVDVNAGFGADKAKAIKAQSESLKRLNELKTMAKQREESQRLEAEREAEKRLAEKNKQTDDLVLWIKSAPGDALDMEKFSDVDNLLKDIGSLSVGKARFGDRTDEVKEAVNSSMAKLNKILDRMIEPEPEVKTEPEPEPEAKPKFVEADNAESDEIVNAYTANMPDGSDDAEVKKVLDESAWHFFDGLVTAQAKARGIAKADYCDAFLKTLISNELVSAHLISEAIEITNETIKRANA